MAITGGFGTTMDLERETSRQWVMGRDGVKRWADTNEPVRHATTLRNDIARCAGTTHETCTICRRREAGHEQWQSHIAPVIDRTTGKCANLITHAHEEAGNDQCRRNELWEGSNG